MLFASSFSAVALACLSIGANAAAIHRRDPVQGASPATNFTSLVVFGDSFSDTGNVFKAYGIPQAPYYQGRYSNGPNWVDHLATRLNATMNNHAFGGAVASKALLPEAAKYKHAAFPPDISEQLAAFLGNNTVYPDPATTLYPIFAGANDYTQSLGAGGLPNPKDIATAVADFIRKLRASPLKAQNIVVLLLPDFGKTPLISMSATAQPGEQALATALTATHNSILSKQIADIQQNDTAIQISTVDLVKLIQDVQSSTNSSGFRNFTAPCLTLKPDANVNSTDQSRDINNLNICSNPDEYLYWDFIHPTTHAHKLVGDAAFEALSAPRALVGGSNAVNGTNSTSGAGGNSTNSTTGGDGKQKSAATAVSFTGAASIFPVIFAAVAFAL
ncbi:hypothetical protein HDU89_000318 [Geranomyces variabilis]|nr:hypothetical protein HDU89_000318 [Geranomyces variabilis]